MNKQFQTKFQSNLIKQKPNKKYIRLEITFYFEEKMI
jgi:hypothetical protein